MPEHLKALVVIVAIATVIFALAASPARVLLSRAGEFERRRNLWFAVTLAVFLSHNIWLFLLIAGVLLFAAASQDDNKVGLVLFVLLAVPPLPAEIPGLGIIRYFFTADYLKLISLTVLLPAFMREIATRPAKQFTEEPADKLLLAYLLMCVCLTFAASTFTGTLRTAFLYFIEIALPYAIASRLPRDRDALRAAFASYVIGAAVMACIGVFEFLKKWLLYSALDEAAGLKWEYGHYLMRDGGLRAMATAGHSIPFGYAMATAIALMLGLRRFFPRRDTWLGGMALLVTGLIASVSRGPWFGALAGVLVFVISGRRVLPNVARLAASGILLVPALYFTPVGEKIIYYFTSVDDGSYSYRTRLFEISVGVILQNPFFGAYEFTRSTAFQELKQGSGIVDIVNTYLAVGLGSGLIGLTLFVAFFVTAMFGVWRQMKSIDDSAVKAHDLGRGLLAALACTMVTILTVSSITVIPVIYYLIAGLAVAYSRWVRAEFGKPQFARRRLEMSLPGTAQTAHSTR